MKTVTTEEHYHCSWCNKDYFDDWDDASECCEEKKISEKIKSDAYQAKVEGDKDE